MAYLKFNKGELVNLEYSLKRELLSTNHAGGYMNTTIVCCNTRKYHGLLVLPVANFNNEKFVSKAPEAKVLEEKEKLAKYEQMMQQVEERLSQMK